ncbi:MAG: heme ABC transporter ATP-binding protein [Acidimicrobiia bacterium]|nr:heme ABC transporter ATP-binding protein [Acidimicrobiia bacterium]MBT8193170.1 heme ABC transporter ATP-binding protein [Acidimicrobiia bacterium]MBT8247835.1 heme ABC transporter ATP-binding protein [Acidimicrobiia bacterium]NNF88274.1 heme ABC transporter ATP-binding protein [Acidimicrobiia bacterium]NNL14390.1 heme ABC transporter ATP-binding protein [Acidimicrobiia bacterium]
MTPAVRAEEITFRRGSAVLVDGVTLTTEPGEIVGIVGPNGAGKTTLLRILAGDLAPTSGRAWLQELDPWRATPIELARVRAYLSPRGVTENPFAVRDTVAMGRHPHRRAMIDADQHDAIVDSAMERTDVLHLGPRIMSSLSSGEQQRVGLARVIAQETPVILLDEPTSSLDIGHQETVMGALRRLADGGTTIIVVLHDINLAAAHSDRIMLLSDGQAAAIGTPSEVLTSERLSTVYRQPMRVVDHPHRDCPLVLTVDHPES